MYGSLGDGSGVDSLSPVVAQGLGAVEDLVGYGNYFAQNTMDGSIADHKLTPVPFVWSGHDISEVIDVQTGRCVKTADQKYYCWGYNAYSVLGDMRFDATKMVFSNKWFEQ